MQKKYLLVISVVLILCSSCVKDVDIERVIDRISVSLYSKADGDPLIGLEVNLIGHPDTYVGGVTNSLGKVVFRQVNANYHNLHLSIQGEFKSKVYSWDSYENGFPDGIDFYSSPDFSLGLNPLFN